MKVSRVYSAMFGLLLGYFCALFVKLMSVLEVLNVLRVFRCFITDALQLLLAFYYDNFQHFSITVDIFTWLQRGLLKNKCLVR